MTTKRHVSGNKIVLVLWSILIAAAVFWIAPKSGYFEWSEAPRNALNGAFFVDLLHERPFGDPVGWAESYYLQYPALTVLFYPPLFHVILALTFSVFGVSHAVAVGTVVGFLLFLLWGVYAIGKHYLDQWAGIFSMLLVSCAPAVLVWSQQVMLEVPMLAFTTWSVYFLAVYVDRRKTSDLALAAGAALCAVYTKQTAVIVLLPMALYVMAITRGSPFRRRSDLMILAIAALLLIPLLIIQWKFGGFNVSTVVDRSDVDIDRFGLEGLFWYGIRLHQIVGIPSILAIVGGGLVTLWCGRWPAARRGVVAMTLWFFAGYALLTTIDLKETRHAVLLAPAAAILGGLLLSGAVRDGRVRRLLFLCGVLVFPVALWAARAPWVSGYAEMAELVGTRVPDGSRVLFLGNRDGSFIFNVRSRIPDKDLVVVRADKLFLNIKIMPEQGLNPRDLSQSEIRALLQRLGIRYIVSVPEIWTDAEVIRNFYAVLAGDDFEHIDAVPVGGSAEESQLLLFRFNGEVKEPPDRLQYQTSVGVMVAE
ncbi:MAG: glycosyltransferase family 39 protein [Candidatus Promineifilaceae bacterium]